MTALADRRSTTLPASLLEGCAFGGGPADANKYLHARYYDPQLGVFLSPDPIGPEGGLNEYGYGPGDPINTTDRSGLIWAIVCGPVEDRWECMKTDYEEVWSGGDYRPPRTIPMWPNGDPVLPGEPNPRPGGIVVTPVPEGNGGSGEGGDGGDGGDGNGGGDGGDGGGITVADVVGAANPAAAVGVAVATALDPKANNQARLAAVETMLKNLVPLGIFGMAAKFAKGGGAAVIKEALAGLQAGRSAGVRVVGSADELEGLFARLSAGGRPVEGTTYPGRFLELSDGTTVGMRATSRSGGPTIDIRLPDGTFRKVHVGE